MVDRHELDILKQINITEVSPLTLTDLQGVGIVGKTAVERLESFLFQVKNPYCFKVGKTPVKVSFAADEDILENKLSTFFIRLKST